MRKQSFFGVGLIVISALLFTFAAVSFASEKVNINTASAEELEGVRGISSLIASRIVEHRQENGPFREIEDIMNVRGVGRATFNIVKDSITVKSRAVMSKEHYDELRRKLDEKKKLNRGIETILKTIMAVSEIDNYSEAKVMPSEIRLLPYTLKKVIRDDKDRRADDEMYMPGITIGGGKLNFSFSIGNEKINDDSVKKRGNWPLSFRRYETFKLGEKEYLVFLSVYTGTDDYKTQLKAVYYKDGETLWEKELLDIDTFRVYFKKTGERVSELIIQDGIDIVRVKDDVYIYFSFYFAGHNQKIFRMDMDCPQIIKNKLTDSSSKTSHSESFWPWDED